MSEPRPGSRKAQVFHKLKEAGAEVAVELGLTLGLAPGTVRSWVHTWSKSEGTPTIKGTILSKDRVAKPIRRKMIKVKWSERQAILIEKGPQVSEVKWLDGGFNQCIPNDQLLFEDVETGAQ